MKVERVEVFNHKMTCCICQGEKAFSKWPSQSQMKKFIQEHVDSCGATDLVSFGVESRAVAIMSRSCEFCQAEGGEYRWGVYCCGACEAVLHRVKQ